MNTSAHKTYKYIGFEKHFPQRVFWSGTLMKQGIVNLNMKYYELNVLGEIGGIRFIYFFCLRPRHEKSSKTKYINALQKHLVAMTRCQRKTNKVTKALVDSNFFVSRFYKKKPKICQQIN